MACPSHVVNCPDRLKQQSNNSVTVRTQNGNAYDKAKRTLTQRPQQNVGGVTVKTTRV
jgi:hypothetical protein